MKNDESINFPQDPKASATFQKDTVLHIAARNGDLKDVTEILNGLNQACFSSDQASSSSNQPVADPRAPNQFGETPLIIACKYGHKETVDKLLEAHQYIAAYDQGASSLMHAAVHGGSVEIVSAILKHCPDDGDWHIKLMTEEDKYGRCAIHVAAIKGHLEIISKFLSVMPNCAEIRSKDEKSVLQFAVEYNQIDIVRELLQNKGEDKVNRWVSRDCDDFHNTALHLAAKNGVDPQFFDLLLSRGVDVNALNEVNNEGKTALDISSAVSLENRNCAYIVKKLKDFGAMPTRRMPNHDDTVNTHMVVASLIATITFAAMFQIPGGIEDNKGSIHYGAAKLAFHKIFRVFIFSDTAAFMTSLSVVVIWLIKQQWQETPLAWLIPHRLSDISQVNLIISIMWTAVAFVTATIIVIIPRDIEKLKSKDNEAFTKYQLFLRREIFLSATVPYLVVYLFIAPYIILAVLRTIIKPNLGGRAVEWFKKTLWSPTLHKRAVEIYRFPGVFTIFIFQAFLITFLILMLSYLPFD